ncbi:MAG: cyclic pyranopterin monophosphate synthase MoaC [Pseudomonadota bacterium]|nr:cyclic pyranopterin monophosphate synthase MoaC [Pseudomonadota bacterium]
MQTEPIDPHNPQPLSHLNAQGEAHMVDIGDKAVTKREAIATGFIHLQPNTLALLQDQALPKGDVLATARIAAIQAAKQTANLIPLCHPLPLTKVAVNLTPQTTPCGIAIEVTCRTTGQTGIEMEALTAVSVAALTLYDMCKAVDKQMVIDQICLRQKTGGKTDVQR